MPRVINKTDFTPRVVQESHNGLTELIIPEGSIQVFCTDNKITELIVPEGVTILFCDDNHLTKLTLPSTLKSIDATNNPNLKEITIPMGVVWANIDPNTQVLNLEEVSADTDMAVRFIPVSSRAAWRENGQIIIR